MSVANTARAPYNDDNAYGPVEITLGQAGEDDSPNLNCDDSDPDLGVICTDLPFGDCCQGENDELFDSADNNQADGWTSFGVYSGSNDHKHQGPQILGWWPFGAYYYWCFGGGF